MMYFWTACGAFWFVLAAVRWVALDDQPGGERAYIIVMLCLLFAMMYDKGVWS